MGRLDGKVVIVTGASGGLGKQMAIRFVEEGANVAICARTEEKLVATAEVCMKKGGEVLTMDLDVCDRGSLEEFVNKTIERFGKIDALVNNAISVPLPEPFMEQSLTTLNYTMQSGFYSTWNMMQFCFPHLKESKGAVVNVLSGAANIGMANTASYASTKGAVRALTMVTAREWGQYGIRVNNLSPAAMTDTIEENKEYLSDDVKQWIEDELKNANPFGRYGDSYEDITPVALFLVCDDSRWMTGQNLMAEGGTVIHA